MEHKEAWKAWLPKEPITPDRKPGWLGDTFSEDAVNQLAMLAFEGDSNSTIMVLAAPDDPDYEHMSIEEWGDGPLMATLHMAMAFAMARGAKEHCNHHGPPKRLAIRISVVAEDD